METNKGKIFLNTVLWGFVLWLFGYVLGFVFFAFVPKEFLGWYILPFGVAFTLWVLLKKIKREEFKCYIGLGIIWTIMAVVLDYIFLVKPFKATNYYKLDVYVYYILTFVLPLIVGWYKFKRVKRLENN
jgi:membrane protein DedA with SNARE-associated domain